MLQRFLWTCGNFPAFWPLLSSWEDPVTAGPRMGQQLTMHLSSAHRSVSPGVKGQAEMAEMETFCSLLQSQLRWSPGAAPATLHAVSAGGSCWFRT